MKYTIKFFEIITFIAIIGFSLTACGDNGNDGEGPFKGTPRWGKNGNAYSILFNTKTNIDVGSGASDSYIVGFTVTANDTNQIIEEVSVYGDRFELIFGRDETFTGSTVIKISYDGTGGLSGKMDSFSNVTVSYDANMYAY